MLDFFLTNLNNLNEIIKANFVIIIVVTPLVIVIGFFILYLENKEKKIKKAFNENKIIYFKNKSEIIELSKSNGWLLSDGYFKKNDRFIEIENNSDNLSL
ncbi:MAG: hypothetical protein WBF48_12840 [Halarcobacter sp.]